MSFTVEEQETGNTTSSPLSSSPPSETTSVENNEKTRQQQRQQQHQEAEEITSSCVSVNNNNRYYKVAGDIINISVLISSIVYAFTVIYFTSHQSSEYNNNIIDDEWKKDGFCISNMDVPYWSSFDTCVYVDLGFSVVLYLLYRSWKDKPGMETSSKVIPGLIGGTIGHGLAHAGMAVGFRDGSYQLERDTKLAAAAAGGDNVVAEDDGLTLWQNALFVIVFWFPLLQASMPKMNKRYVLCVATMAVYMMQGLKKELSFGYVQTVLSIAFHVSQLCFSTSDEKHQREYMTMPLSAILPIVTAWNELLFCSAYFKSAGGHVLYDASIIISYIVFYMDCYRYHVLRSTATTKKKKD